MMVESEIQELTEEKMLEAVMFAHAGMQPVIDAIIELAEHAAKEPFDFQAEDHSDVVATMKKLVGEDLRPPTRSGQVRAPLGRRRGQGRPPPTPW